VWAACVCAALAAAVGPLPGAGPEAPGTPAADAAVLPASLEAALVMHDAASARRSPAGRAAWAGLTQAGLLGPRTGGAWEELARALGVSGEEAFDALLGRSCTLLVRGMTGPGPSEWAMVCRVDEATRQRVVRSLSPAPAPASNPHRAPSPPPRSARPRS
jgi:hypothetical protein